jgi:hypothetical protein
MTAAHRPSPEYVIGEIRARQSSLRLDPDSAAEIELATACLAIILAPDVATIRRECFSIGTLAAYGALPIEFVLQMLHWASARWLDDERPSRRAAMRRTVRNAFARGLADFRG